MAERYPSTPAVFAVMVWDKSHNHPSANDTFHRTLQVSFINKTTDKYNTTLKSMNIIINLQTNHNIIIVFQITLHGSV